MRTRRGATRGHGRAPYEQDRLAALRASRERTGAGLLPHGG